MTAGASGPDGGALFFEGTEKKVELVIDPSLPSLRSLGRGYWDGVVDAAQARILSVISNEHCDAYLLSESSLFVFDHKMVMLTCGKTTLPPAVLRLLETFTPKDVQLLAYERKNEVYPHRQPTSFFEDAAMLHERLPGTALQFGDEDEHHLYLFQVARGFVADERDQTAELLMYDIDRDLRPVFEPSARGGSPAVQLKLNELMPGFKLDEHLFQPRGYSLNGILDDQYLTIHVTPDELGSYASFETNYRFDGDLDARIGRVLDVFRPRAFDLITWTTDTPAVVATPNYKLKTHVAEDLSCGYQVHFKSHFRPQTEARGAIELPLNNLQETTGHD
jgi:S-adenosylmethionine decarboxylase